jgi:5-methylthioadenosine/S-adenosylhomocysteine deaminase
MAFEAIIHKGYHQDPTIVASSDVLKMTTCNASSLFPNNSYMGTLEVNSPADLIVIDLDSPTTTPIINPESHLCHAVGREQVAMTIVNGSIVYHNGKFLTLDIESIKQETQRITDRLLSS